MNTDEIIVIEEIRLPVACSELISSYRPNMETGFCINEIAHRYSKIVRDVEQVKARFSPGQLSWIKSTVLNWPNCEEAEDELFYQVNMDVEHSLDLYESSVELPDAWEEMLDQLKSLSIGEEFALIEWLERQIRLDEAKLPWPAAKEQGDQLAAS